MAIQNFLIMNLLRLITPEEIGDIATKHNGGKFLSLTDLVSERVDHKIYRDFSSPDSMDEIHDAHNLSTQAKILPFKKPMFEDEEVREKNDEVSSLNDMANATIETNSDSKKLHVEVIEHKENENMSSFILIEKARLKRSQQILKQKEIIDLYQKNSNVDVEQIKGSNNNLALAREAGVLVNKKQY
ncbi:MAG: hypothetical protein H7281_17320 [Bacteriovorax sp.]|nr:hypothetical protein [Bacteriovorax sp.]